MAAPDATEATNGRRKIAYEGGEWPIAGCNCSGCGNFFFYVDLPEFAPRVCCYCGLKFRWYEDPEGVPRDLNGLPRESGR